MSVSPAALGAAWAGLFVIYAYGRRPPPRRVRRLALDGVSRARSTVGPAEGGSRPGPGAAALGMVDRLGSAVLRRAGRPARPFTSRRVGLTLVGAITVLPLNPLLALPAGAMGWAAPALGARRVAARQLNAVRAELPDVVDLFALAVGAGYTVRLAVVGVGRRATGLLGVELRRAGDEAALGRRLADALSEIPVRAGEPVRPLVAALVASERYGAPLAAGLERLADEVRRDRRRRAEEAARQIPVKLLFPLVTCTLPAFALLTVAPLIASALRSLRLT